MNWEKDKIYNLANEEEFELYFKRLEYYISLIKISGEII
jgi:hypothetical protein